MSRALALPDTIRTVPSGLAFWAEQTPDALALLAVDGRTLSHRQLQAAIRNVMAQMAARGVSANDRVALVLPPGLDLAVVGLATMSVATAVPLDANATAHELERDLRRIAARLLVTNGADGESAWEVAATIGLPTVAVGDLLAGTASGDSAPAHNTAPEDVAVILHTSGTTGLPKRVPRPHGTLVAGALAARRCSGIGPADVALVTSRMHTVAGVIHLLTALLNGGSAVVTPGLDPVAYPDWLETLQPTWTSATPTELELILRATERAGRERVAGAKSRLRVIRAGAQPLPAELANRVERSFGAQIFDQYAMTEASYIAACGPTARDRRARSCGRPLGVAVRILDEAGEEVAPGIVGEIVIHGDTLFPGYLDDPVANAAAFLSGGWFRTGDLGYRDEDGFLFLTGRVNELINRGGEKIAPAEVDAALLEHPAVADAAVFAVPDDRLGEEMVAAVVLKPTGVVTARQVRSWLLDRLALTKAPRRIWFVSVLPRTPTGKVMRWELTRRWQEEAG